MRETQTGFTLLELLIVLAIVGIVAGIAVMAGRPIVRGQEANAAVKSVQQSVWQGATMAASRGVETTLVLAGSDLEVRNADTGAVIRRFELPDDASLNVADGPLLTFTPPGKVDEDTLPDPEDPLVLTAGDRAYDLQISLIGEVRATARAP